MKTLEERKAGNCGIDEEEEIKGGVKEKEKEKAEEKKVPGSSSCSREAWLRS